MALAIYIISSSSAACIIYM